jgi:very-short-patch-repair endonuclease
VAVESDGSPSASALSVRERSRLRPQQLERTGWNYLTLWTIEVFSDPDTVAELIRRYLGLPGGPGGSSRAG